MIGNICSLLFAMRYVSVVYVSVVYVDIVHSVYQYMEGNGTWNEYRKRIYIYSTISLYSIYILYILTNKKVSLFVVGVSLFGGHLFLSRAQ